METPRRVEAWASGQSALWSASWVRVRVSPLWAKGNGGFVCSSTSLRGRRRCRVLPFPTAHLGRGQSSRLDSQPAQATSGPEGVRPGRELQTHSGPRHDPPGKEYVRVRAWAGGLHRGEEREGTGASRREPGGLPWPREPHGFPQPQTGGEEGRVRSRPDEIPYPIRTNAHAPSRLTFQSPRQGH